jgi:uncharacterized protein (TIGR02145 family)
MKALSIVLVYLLLNSCRDRSLPPQAKLTIYPPTGDTTILFELNATESFDEKFYPAALVYRWDLDGDLAWDTKFSNESVSLKHFVKPGTHSIAVEVMNPDGQSSITKDTILVYGRNPVSSLTDSRDGQTYSVVKINGLWWMSESLRYGIVVDPWNQGMNDNNIAERMLVEVCNRPGSYSVYSWYEAMNYHPNDNQGICPDGWHIPTQKEWQSLYVNYPLLFVAKNLGENGLSGLNLQNGVLVANDLIDKTFECNLEYASYWGSDHREDASGIFYAGHLNFLNNRTIVFAFLDQGQLDGSAQKQIVNSVRCIKDHE